MCVAIRLRDLDGEITVTDWGDGLRLRGVMFRCPTCRTHVQVIPFDSEQRRIKRRDGSGDFNVWKHVIGETIEDITLSPSISVPSCGGLHGFITAGTWVPC